MNTPKLLVLVRHGFSLANEVKLGDGYYVSAENAGKIENVSDEDVPLTDAGRHQAVMTGPFIREAYGTFDAVYDSGYARAVSTRQAMLGAYPTDELLVMETRECYLVRERERGYTFAMTAGDARGHFPWAQKHFEKFGHFYNRSPGGQSHADMCLQVDHFLDKLNQEWAGKKVLVVTHGHTIRAFRYLLEGWTPKSFNEMMNRDACVTDNCGVTEYRQNLASNKLELVSFNKIYWQNENSLALGV